MKQISIFAAIVFLFYACQSDNAPKVLDFEQINSNKQETQTHKVIVKEVLQVGAYTYLNVTEKDSEQWLAVPSMNAKTGEVYYFEGGMVMKNFKSKELNRTFDEVLFLEKVRKTQDMKQETMVPHAGKPKLKKQDIHINPAKSGITIQKIYAEKQNFENKSIEIRGKVTKVNEAIMKKNWVHIQDGTEFSGKSDLTITTQQLPHIGDTVTFKGKIVIDKDFGYGYFYEVIMEDGEIVQ